MIDLAEKNGMLVFKVRVVPRASKSEIVGELGDALKIRLTAPPIDGAANKELIKLLSKTFGISKSEVEILSGGTSKTKRIRIAGLKKKAFLKSVGE